MLQSDESTHQSSPRQFATTQWSAVKAAAHPVQGAAAMTRLFQSYWNPLYGFLRREGRSREEAEDLLQEFFLRLQSGSLFTSADPGRGRFRSLLLMSLRNLETDFFRAARCQKRGAGAEMVPLDAEVAESAWNSPADTGLTPEAAYDRAWARTLLQRAEQRLRETCDKEGKMGLFNELMPYVTGGKPTGEFPAAAERLGMNEKTARVALSRLRRRYASVIREEVAETVGPDGDVQDELRYLMENFS